MNLGQSLIVCFVDFSKAFDLINRDILFYKIIKSGLYGRVLDTLRDLYRKTSFRIKYSGKLSPSIPQTVGVNQGGNASPTIFREYMSDMMDYLDEHTGVCLSDVTISERYCSIYSGQTTLYSSPHLPLQPKSNCEG